MERASPKEATALVIEDDVVLRATLADLLVEEGFHKVIQASNGFSGLRMAIEHRPQIVLLDLMLPELSGTDVLRELRSGSNAREMAIVVVTGRPDELSESQTAELDGVVRKPFDVSTLLALLHRALQRAAARAAEVAPVSPTSAVHALPKRSSKVSGAARRARGRR